MNIRILAIELHSTLEAENTFNDIVEMINIRDK